MVPMAFVVLVTFCRWCNPTAAMVLISSVSFMPVFVYPYVAWAWLLSAYYYARHRAYVNIDLRRSRLGAAK